MPDAYQTLGVPSDADDAAIRKRYLELVREFPPEQHPERFAAVRSAFEKIRTLDGRAKYWLFHRAGEDTIEGIIEELACKTSRQRFTLTQLTTVAFDPQLGYHSS